MWEFYLAEYKILTHLFLIEPISFEAEKQRDKHDNTIIIISIYIFTYAIQLCTKLG